MGLLALLGAWFGYSVGLLAFVAVPWLVSDRWPQSMRTGIARFYWGLAQAGFFRVLIAAREHASTVMGSASPTKFGSLRISYNDGPQDYEDVANRMRYHRDKPLGFGIDTLNVVVDPLDAIAGALTKQYREEGVTEVAAPDDVDADHENALGDHIKLPAYAPLVNLHDAAPVIGGAAEPDNTDVHAEEIKKSQDPFSSTNYWDIMQLAMAFVGAMLAIYILFVLKSNMEGGGNGGGGGTGIVSPTIYLPADAIYQLVGVVG